MSCGRLIRTSKKSDFVLRLFTKCCYFQCEKLSYDQIHRVILFQAFWFHSLSGRGFRIVFACLISIDKLRLT